MKINLTICGVRELPDQKGKHWTHVISIWDKAYLYDPACRELVKAVAPRADLLFCFFADTFVFNHPEAPRLRDVKRILDFTKELSRRGEGRALAAGALDVSWAHPCNRHVLVFALHAGIDGRGRRPS